MTRTLLAWGSVLILLASLPCRAEDFVLEVVSPKFKVTLPGIPGMRMDVHPRNDSHPHMRLIGTEHPYAIAVFTPAAAAGMTPLECASATVRAFSARPGIPPPEEIYKARLNDRTLVAIYVTRENAVAHLHAHLMSAVAGTHCIEVHVTKASLLDDEIDVWVNAFEQANIDPG